MHKDVRSPGELPTPELLTLDEAMRRLEPVPPEQPHLLMAPDELLTALDVADALNGELPHWHRGRPDWTPMPRADEELERELEKAKGAAAGLSKTGDPPVDEDE